MLDLDGMRADHELEVWSLEGAEHAREVPVRDSDETKAVALPVAARAALTISDRERAPHCSDALISHGITRGASSGCW